MALPRIPEPDEAAIFIYYQNEKIGPMSRQELSGRVRSGALGEQSLLWLEGMEAWAKLIDHPEILVKADAAEPAAEPAAEAALEAAEAPSDDGAPQPKAIGHEPVSQEEDDHFDEVFGRLIETSWDYLKEHEIAAHVDEVFLGSVITCTLDGGYSLIDLSSDGTNHYLRFEDLEDHSRVVFRLTHLTGTLESSRVLGQRARVVVGYGEKIGNVGKILSALKAEFKSGFIHNPEPGTFVIDGDLTSGYIYAQVDMYWKIDDYVGDDFEVNTDRMTEHISACINALRKYLRGRFA